MQLKFCYPEPYLTFCEVRLKMRRAPRNLKIACDHAGLTHFGGIYFFHEFLRVRQFRDFLARHLVYPRRHHRYSLSQAVLAMVYPILLGLDRIETASFLRSNGTFQYLTGLPSFPDPQTLRRFLRHAPGSLREQLRAQGWSRVRRIVVVRRLLEEHDPQPTLFAMGRYVYRAWATNLDLTPPGVWHFYAGRAGVELRIHERREAFALRKIPTASFAANALHLELIRLAGNLVTAFQRTGLPASLQTCTLQQLRLKLFLLPGELTRPQNRPTLRLQDSPLLQRLAQETLARIAKLRPL
jgi:hypothetical protein